MRRFVTALCCWLLLAGVQAAPEATLQAIHFAGNKTTRPEVMLQEMSIQVGDAVDAQRIEESRQAIMNLGLFSEVQTEVREEDAGPVLLITVKEKFYILPIPRLGLNQEGEADYGLELRFDNLRGLNQRLKLLHVTKDSVSGDTPLRRESSLSYTYPRLIGTPYQLSLGLKHVREDLAPEEDGETVASYSHQTHEYGIGLSRWLRETGPSQGVRFGGRIGLRDELYDHHSGVEDYYVAGRDVQFRGFVEYYGIHEETYRRVGEAYGYTFEAGVPELGDFSYQRHLLHYRRYLPRGDHNLNYRLYLGLAGGEAYGEPAFELGSANTLRGYEEEYLTGNALLLGSVEYLFPLFGYRPLRGALFVDAGNVQEDIGSADLGDFKFGAGLGLRWKVQFLVDVTIRVDVAWGLEAGTQMTYVDTSTAF